MSPIRILVVAEASPTREDVLDVIEREAELQLAGSAASSSQAVTAIRELQPDIALIDEVLGDVNTLSLTEDLADQYPELTLVAMTREGHMDFARQAMLAGARGFVTIPSDIDDLSQSLHQIHRLERSRRTSPQQPPAEQQRTGRGKVIVVYSPKGGVGKTTLAANLGTSLARETEDDVIMVDSSPQFGHLGLVMNVHANYSVMDLLSQTDELDRELIEGMMASHSSGARVLLAPSEIERVDALPPQAMSQLLSQLRSMSDWVIVDTWPVLTESTLDVLEVADRTLLLILPDITCLRDTKQFLDLADSLNFSLNKFDIIVNRATEGGLDRNAIEDGVGREVVMEIPQDDPLVTHSLNRGVPLVMSHKRSPVSKAVGELTQWIVTDGEEPVAEPGLGARVRRLLGATGL